MNDATARVGGLLLGAAALYMLYRMHREHLQAERGYIDPLDTPRTFDPPALSLPDPEVYPSYEVYLRRLHDSLVAHLARVDRLIAEERDADKPR